MSRNHHTLLAVPMLLTSLLLLLIGPLATDCLPDVITIGGLFEDDDIRHMAAFEYAIDEANNIASFSRKGRPRLRSSTALILNNNSFKASKSVCNLLSGRVAAIFGPQSPKTAAHVQSICDAMGVPHVEIRWDYRILKDDYSVNLFPNPKAMSKAYLDLIRLYGWDKFCILYEDNAGLIRVQEILKNASPNEFQRIVRQLPPRGSDFRPVLRGIRNDQYSNIILDCKPENVEEVMKQAQQIGMVTGINNYIITSLDAHFMDMEDFKYGGTNITSLGLLDRSNSRVMHIMRQMSQGVNAKRNRGSLPLKMGTEAALMYDAVQVFVMAIQALDNSTVYRFDELSCEKGNAWVHGNSLINFMKMVNMTGVTGHIEFDSLGYRTNFDLQIIELHQNGFETVGTWDIKNGVNYTGSSSKIESFFGTDSLRNKTLIVAFAFNSPYIMLSKSAEKLTGNARYEGFCVSLLDEISERLGFNYTLKSINGYGKKDNVTGEWNGMIRELIYHRADMAITDLTINLEREEAVDFTKPFMNLGISIIYKKPRKVPPELFSFLSPFSNEVWVYMITAYVGVSMILYILARFSPYEWQNPHPCDPDPETLENQFTLLNCMWFSIGSLMQQGCDFLPQAVSTRMVAGMWWFFTLIMISSYTANLAAFLTVENLESPIESVEDLAKQTKVKYGAYGGGSTASFFKNSEVDMYKKMYEYMSTTPGGFMPSNKAGYDRAVAEDYAFLSESTSIEYVTERECDLQQVGNLLDSKSYGIALPPGSIYKNDLDVTILRLQAEGRIHILKKKWWKEMHGGGKCKDDETPGGANELNLSNVGGVFVVLIGGMGLALIVAILEFLGECNDIAKEEEVPFMKIFRQEFRFVMKCKGSTKPVRRKPSEYGDSKTDDDEEDDEEDLNDPIYGEDTDVYSGYGGFGSSGKHSIT